MSNADFVLASALPWIRSRVDEVESTINDQLHQNDRVASAKKSGVVWRTEGVENGLVYWDTRHPDVVFQDHSNGFVWAADSSGSGPLGPYLDLVRYVKFSEESFFLTTTRTYRSGDGTLVRWAPNQTSNRFEYRIFAYGGIDLNATLCENRDHSQEREVVFVGGVRRDFIRSANEYDDQGKLIRVWVNTHFDISANGQHQVPDYRLPEVLDYTAGVQIVYWNNPGNYQHYSTLPHDDKRRSQGDSQKDPDTVMRQPGGWKAAPGTGPTPVRSAFGAPWFNNGSIYFFQDDQYCRVGVDSNNHDSLIIRPKPYPNAWKTLSHFPHINAFIPYPNGGGVWALSENQYCRSNINSSGDDTSGGNPTGIDKWNSVKAAGFGRVDAVILKPNDNRRMWIFHGRRYMRIRLDEENGIWQDHLEFGPRLILDHWACLKRLGFDSIDFSAPDRTNASHVYVFKGPRYACINIDSDSVITGPNFVAHSWPSLAQAGWY